jgi:hypothetical protein
VSEVERGILLATALLGPGRGVVRGRVEVLADLLARHVRAFPTWSEAIYPAVCSLAAELY